MIRETAFDWTATEGNVPIQWYEELNTKLQPEIIDAIISLSNDWITVVQLEEKLGHLMKISTEKFRYHLLWLLKYNRLTLDVDTIGQTARELAHLLA